MHLCAISPSEAVANGSVSEDRYVVPFTYAARSTEARVNGLSLLPLHTYYLAVHACYPAPAGCYDPVISDGLGVDDVRPDQGNVLGSFSEYSNMTVGIIASWNHFQEVMMYLYIFP